MGLAFNHDWESLVVSMVPTSSISNQRFSVRNECT